jgi:group I intron endonuclease
MEKKFNFVYITTNLINGKQYVGDHSTDNLEKDKYLGSGIRFIKSINFYGKENFKREILEHFSTKKEAFAAQEKYIIERNTLSPNGYNLSPIGGAGPCGLSIESLRKMSKTKTGKHLGENHHYFGKQRSAEDKLKISNTMKTVIMSDKTKKKLSEFALNIEKIKCTHCQMEMAPWTYVRHHKALLKKGIIIPEYINKIKIS